MINKLNAQTILLHFISFSRKIVSLNMSKLRFTLKFNDCDEPTNPCYSVKPILSFKSCLHLNELLIKVANSYKVEP